MPTLKGIFFDQDGVIIDTERDGHRVAFNQTFQKRGFSFSWSEEEYHQLLQVAGGKERMRHYLHTKGFGRSISKEEEETLIPEMHKQKTEAFIRLLQSGSLPLRPGVQRIMQEANQAGHTLGICTTSNEKAAQAVSAGLLSEIQFDFVLAGDIVHKKKPAPDIYLLALEKSGLQPDQCLVFEDSRNGVLAAKAAGMRVVATTNPYTEKEDLSAADIVVSCLGDPDGEKSSVRQGGCDLGGILTLQKLEACLFSA